MGQLIERIKAMLHAHSDKVLFLVVGGLNTVFAYVLFAIGLSAASLFIPDIRSDWIAVDVVLVCTWLVSVTFSWGMFKLLVFRTRGTNWIREWARSYAVYAPSIVMNLGALSALVGLLHIPPLIGQAMWAVFMAFYSYFGHKWFTFGTPREGRPEPTTWEEPADSE